MIGLRVAHLVSSLNPNGATSSAINLMRWLRGHGHETVVASTGGDREEHVADAGIDLVRYEPGGAGWLLAGKRRLARTLAEWQPDLLHVHRLDCLQQGIVLAGKLQLPLVVSVHAWVRGKPAEVLHDPDISLIVVPTEAQRSWYCTKVGLHRDRVAVLPYGLDLDRFVAEHTGAVDTLGMLGNFAEESSGWGHTIAALRHLAPRYPQLRSLFIGRGAGREVLAGQLAKAGLDERAAVEDAGPELAPALARMDVFAYPVERDSHSLGLLKAMASGCAVVASAVGGVTELIKDHRSGLLVPPGDAKAFADAVASLIETPDRARDLGRAARAIVAREHHIDTVGAVAHEMYRSVLRGASGAEAVTAWRRISHGG